jgi:acetolactate synthase-1/2/3 large subunit
VFGLQGGHIQPVWDQLARLGVAIVDVRDEAAAVHMAHAHSELTGQPGIALATAGPGVTNTVTAVANAWVSRIPVLVIGGCPPRPQANMGPLQDIPHTEILRPVTRASRTLRVAEQVLRELDEAWARAEGDRGDPGPVYVEIPTDVLRETVPSALVSADYLRPRPRRRPQPDPADVEAAAGLLRSAQRPAVISGRGARTTSGAELVRLLDASGAAYLDTQESRGLVPPGHPAVAGSARSAVMRQADVVVTVGRQLDYQLGFGSPAVFPQARFVRIADTAAELIDNRRGEVEILADVASTLDAMAAALAGWPAVTRGRWRDELHGKHLSRAGAYAAGLAESAPGPDGRMHPNRIFGALAAFDLADTIVVADGGDLLSFARLGITACHRYLDPGAFGCLGVGVPYAIAAALACPERQVLTVTGDGALGINAMEIDTAVRHGARTVTVVANNAAWNIERYDQQHNYGLVAGTELRDSDYAMVARGLGAHGERVEDPADLEPALKRAFASAPALVDVIVTRDAPSPDAGKGLGFVPDYQALSPWNDAEIERRRT